MAGWGSVKRFKRGSLAIPLNTAKSYLFIRSEITEQKILLPKQSD